MRILEGPRKAVWFVTFAPDGLSLATGGDGWVTLWDLSTEKPLRSSPLRYSCHALAFSPDQQLLAALDGEVGHRGQCEVLVWPLARPAAPPARGLAGKQGLWFHPSGSWLLTWDSSAQFTRRDIATWAPRPLWDGLDWSYASYSLVSVSPDGRALARQFTCSEPGGWQETLEVYDLDSGALRQTVPLQGRSFHTGAFCPDGRHFLRTCENELVVVDLLEGKEALRRKYARKRFQRLTVSPNGRWVLTAPAGKEIQLWRGADWQVQEAFTFPVGEVHCLAVAPDGQRAAAGGSSGKIVIWDLD